MVGNSSEKSKHTQRTKKKKTLAIHSQSHLNLVSAQSKVNDIEGNQCDGIQCKPWFYLGDMRKQQVKVQTCYLWDI